MFASDQEITDSPDWVTELSAAQDQLIGARIAYRKAVNAYYTKTK